MPQEDYLKREIDKLGKVLAKVLADLLKLKSANKAADGIESVNEVFKTELDITINALLDIPETEFLPFLLLNRKLNNNQLELLADILTEAADDSENEKALLIYKRSLLIYAYVTENETDYSVNRHYKIESLTALVKNFS